MHVHLAEKRRRDGVAVALIGEHRHARLQAERTQDHLGDPLRQAVKGSNEQRAALRCMAPAINNTGAAQINVRPQADSDISTR